jgi:hypothetical protein
VNAVDRIYRRTAAGEQALKSAEVGVAEGEYRRILLLIRGDMHFKALRMAVPEHSENDVHEWLVELERRGLVASVAAGNEHDLDFTGSFKTLDIAAANRGK